MRSINTSSSGGARGARLGLRLSALLLGSAAVLAMQGPFIAPAAMAQAAPVSFSIQPQPLATALSAFIRASGWQVGYASGAVAGKSSPGVSGTLAPGAALEALLAGTGVSARIDGAASATLVAASPAGGDGAALAPDGSLQLDTINVTGAGGAGAAADAPFSTPGSASLITAEQMERVPPQSTGDILKGAPGVFSAGNRNGVSMNVNIRGLQGQNRVNTMVDGAMQQSSSYRGYSGHDSRVYVDPEFLAGIEIEKGPGGSPGAMGGSVNMRTISASDIVEDGNTFGARFRGSLSGNRVAPDLSRTVRGTAGNANLAVPPPLAVGLTGGDNYLDGSDASGSAVVAMANDTFEVLGGYAYHRAGNYFAGTHGQVYRDDAPKESVWYRFAPYGYGEEVFNTSQETSSIIAKAKLKPLDDHSLELGYVRYDSLYGEGYADTMLPLGTTGNYSKRNYPLSTVVADTYTARYRWSPDNPLYDVSANLWASNVANEWNGYNLGTRVFTWGGDLANTTRLASDHADLKLNYGAQYFIEDVQSRNLTTGGASTNNMNGERSMASGFARSEYTLFDVVRFDVGVRFDTFDVNDAGSGSGRPPKSGSKLNPNLGLVLMPMDGVQLFATYAEGWRPPSVREAFVSSSVLNANPDLRPERSKNVELGFNVLRDSLLTDNDRLRLKVAYFDNNYEDYIARMNPGGGVKRGFRNMHAMKMRGIEISGGYDAGWLFADGSFNYYTSVEYCITTVCAEETGGDDYGSYHIPPKYSGVVSAGVRLFDERLMVGGRVTFAGKRAIGRSGASNDDDWAPYQVYDLFGSYEISKNVKLDFSVGNLTDLYYLDAITDARLPSPGRTAKIGLTAKF